MDECKHPGGMFGSLNGSKLLSELARYHHITHFNYHTVMEQVGLGPVAILYDFRRFQTAWNEISCRRRRKVIKLIQTNPHCRHVKKATLQSSYVAGMRSFAECIAELIWQKIPSH